MEQKTSNNYLKLLPYFGSVIIFFGVLRLICYYDYFGVNIVRFLQFSEIITSFFDTLYILIFLIIFSLIQNFLLENKNEVVQRNTLKNEILNEPKFLVRFKLYFALHGTIWFQMFGLLIIYSIISIFRGFNVYDVLKAFGLFASFFLCAVVMSELEAKHHRLDSTQHERTFYTTIGLFVIFMAILIGMSYDEASQVAKQKKYFGTSVKFNNDSTFVSDSMNYYIGNTQNYLFIHHQNENSTEVLPMAEIKRILFIRRKVNAK